MKKIINKLNAFFKGLALLFRPHIYLGWLKRPLFMSANTLALSKWISEQERQDVFNDFYSPSRNYVKRVELHQYVIDKYGLGNESIDYLEFGVCGGTSFEWWMKNAGNSDNRFHGFDTFEGLPENWGVYKKGDMSANVPVPPDSRGTFYKGLFQDTLPGFLSAKNLCEGKRKVIHLDADLFSSTLFALTSLAPYLKKNDMLLFDEFNVPNHEFFAFKMFCDSYYIKTKLVGAVNNYYQVALIIL